MDRAHPHENMQPAVGSKIVSKLRLKLQERAALH
jgi:hypothetical protein